MSQQQNPSDIDIEQVEAPGEAAPDQADQQTEQPTETAQAGEAQPAEEGAAPGTPDTEVLRQEIEALRRQAAGNLELAQRAQAEMENLRKRTAREVENAHRYALERFMKELLPVVDSMELGVEAAASADDIAGLREGLDLTLKKFLDTLGKFGVQRLDPVGQKFNPEQHEAVSMQQLDGKEAGTVITVMQKGYELNGRLLRPAMVVVAR